MRGFSSHLIDWTDPINWSHPLNRGLRAAWLVHGGTGYSGRLRDLCGRSHFSQGTTSYKPDWIGSERPGGRGAIDGDATNTSMSTADAPHLNVASANAITVAFWAKPNSGSNNFEYVLAKTDFTAAGGWGVYRSGSTAVLVTNGSSSSEPSSSSFWQDDEWHHYILTADTSSISRFYRDGVLFYSTGATVSFGDNTSKSLFVGHRAQGIGSTYCWNGALDDLRLYARRFYDFDAMALYQSSAAGYPEVLNPIGRRWAPRVPFASVAAPGPVTGQPMFQAF